MWLNLANCTEIDPHSLNIQDSMVSPKFIERMLSMKLRVRIVMIVIVCGGLMLLYAVTGNIWGFGVLRKSTNVSEFALYGLKDHNQYRFSSSQRERIPVYYINLNRSPGRRRYVETKFSNGFIKDSAQTIFQNDIPDISLEAEVQTTAKTSRLESVPDVACLTNNRLLRRIEAVDGHNITSLEEIIPEQQSISDLPSMWSSTFGEIGLTMSHFKAIKTAYDDGYDTAIILEDDAGEALTHFWIWTPEDVVAALEDESYGEVRHGFRWSMVRLQYTLKPPYAGFYEAWKTSRNSVFMDGKDCCYGTVAQIISRRGMIEILEMFHVGNGRFDCRGVDQSLDFSKIKCASDHILPLIMSKVLITTPPMFSIRLAEGSTGVRCSISDQVACDTNDNLKFHQSSLLMSLKWSIEAEEYWDSVGHEPIDLPAYDWVVT